jgi:hypothetical protein
LELRTGLCKVSRELHRATSPGAVHGFGTSRARVTSRYACSVAAVPGKFRDPDTIIESLHDRMLAT